MHVSFPPPRITDYVLITYTQVLVSRHLLFWHNFATQRTNLHKPTFWAFQEIYNNTYTQIWPHWMVSTYWKDRGWILRTSSKSCLVFVISIYLYIYIPRWSPRMYTSLFLNLYLLTMETKKKPPTECRRTW